MDRSYDGGVEHNAVMGGDRSPWPHEIDEVADREPMPVLAATETDADTETETDTRTRLAPPWNVVVYDDPVTLMTYVTRVFVKVFGYAEPKARRLMMEVHTKGRSVVWTGGREQAEVYVQKLQSHHLLASLEPAE